MSDPRLSIIIPTARASYGSLRGGLEQTHLFAPAFESFERQTFKDFEIVIGDCVCRHRDLTAELSMLGNWSFRWRVVPVTGGWLDLGMTAIQRPCNAGAIHADGEYLMFTGDACEFPEDTLARVDHWLRLGRQPHALVVYKMGRELAYVTPEIAEQVWDSSGRGLTVKELQERGVFGNIIRDSRWPTVEERGGLVTDMPWQWSYANATMHRREYLAINGFDENFDGDKSLGDVDVGSRLEMSGHWRPVLDASLFTYEFAQTACDPRVLWRTGIRAIRCNYTLMHLLRDIRQRTGNNYRLTPAQFKHVLTQGYVPRYTRKDPEARLQVHWIRNQPQFNVTDLWKARRHAEGKDPTP